jgi:hypothetical protein
MSRTVVAGLATAALLALTPLPLGAMPPAQAATPVRTVQVAGTVQRMLPYSLVLQMPKHRLVRVYFASITPLLARFGRTMLVAEIKSGHRLVITGKYQGSKNFFATVIRDTSIT